MNNVIDVDSEVEAHTFGARLYVKRQITPTDVCFAGMKVKEIKRDSVRSRYFKSSDKLKSASEHTPSPPVVLTRGNEWSDTATHACSPSATSIIDAYKKKDIEEKNYYEFPCPVEWSAGTEWRALPLNPPIIQRVDFNWEDPIEINRWRDDSPGTWVLTIRKFGFTNSSAQAKAPKK